ncbi:hypothetical protein [Phytopseudomonas flavescens]|nr:hypothetical protein [Pseudomonas flavescens]
MKYLAIGALGVIVLSGCDAAQDAANKAVEEAKESATQIAKDAFSDSAKQLSEQIDDAQESTRSWIDGESDEDEKSTDEADAARRDEA